MNFSEKVAEIEGKVKSYRLEIEGVEEIPAEEMVRVMLEEGKMLEPCRIIGDLWWWIWKKALFFPFQ